MFLIDYSSDNASHLSLVTCKWTNDDLVDYLSLIYYYYKNLYLSISSIDLLMTLLSSTTQAQMYQICLSMRHNQPTSTSTNILSEKMTIFSSMTADILSTTSTPVTQIHYSIESTLLTYSDYSLEILYYEWNH